MSVINKMQQITTKLDITIYIQSNRKDINNFFKYFFVKIKIYFCNAYCAVSLYSGIFYMYNPELISVLVGLLPCYFHFLSTSFDCEL